MKIEGWKIILAGAITQTVLNICLFLLTGPLFLTFLPLVAIDQSYRLQPPWFILNVMFLNLITYVLAIWVSFSNFRKMVSAVSLFYGMFLLSLPLTKVVDLGLWLMMAPVIGAIVLLGGLFNWRKV